ncbi:hypothetical protein [Lutibacter sp.]|uniref:hypothetical protein n=1 Tax=Lutibacter sp. TaxID=1925666 RepID=UPI00349FDC37
MIKKIIAAIILLTLTFSVNAIMILPTGNNFTETDTLQSVTARNGNVSATANFTGTLLYKDKDVLRNNDLQYTYFNRRMWIDQPLGWSAYPALSVGTDNTGGGYERPDITFRPNPNGGSTYWGVSNGGGGCYPDFLKFDRLSSEGQEICGFDFALDSSGSIDTNQNIGLREDKKIMSREHGALSYWVIWDGYDGELVYENGIDVDMFKYNNGGWKRRDIYYLRAVGDNEADMEWDSDVDIEFNEADLYLGETEQVLIHYDGTQLVFDTSGAGNTTAYFSNDISATGFITRTYETDLTDKEAYILVKNALSNEYNPDGSYNHEAWGECYTKLSEEDTTKPIYAEEVVETSFEESKELIATLPDGTKDYKTTWGKKNETISVLQGYEQKKVDGVNLDCKQVMLSKYNNYIDSYLNPKETPNGLMIDTDIISAQAIYTESKTVHPSTNYADIFKQDISKKETHYAVKNIAGSDRLDVEERIVALEGAMQQIITESCIHYKEYSWCLK